MRPSQIIQAVVALLRAGLVPIIHGAPGCAKTDCIEQAVLKVLNWDLLTCHPIVDEPIDYKGLPGIHEGKAEFLPYGNLRRMQEAKKQLVVFADDIGQAMASVQAAWMQLLLARQINGSPISTMVQFCAATNRAEDRAGVQRMLTPLANRAVHLDMDVNNEDWQEWALTHGISAEVRTFLKWKPASLLIFSGAEAQADRAFPSPRSWAILSRALTDMSDDLVFDVARGTVGKGTGTEFSAYLKIFRHLPQEPKRVLDDPMGVEVPIDPATCWAMCGAVSNLVKSANDAQANNIARYAARMTQQFATLIMRDAVAVNRLFLKSPAAQKWIAENKEALVSSAK